MYHTIVDPNFLTFTEWRDNGVCVSFNCEGVRIFSLQEKKLFKAGDHVLKGKLEDKNELGALLLKIYKDNFDWIQEQFRQSLTNNS